MRRNHSRKLRISFVAGDSALEARERKRLLLRARPLPHESFLGFILRLAELNDCDSPTWITQEAGLGYVGRKCAATSHKPINLSALSNLTDVNLAELESLRYPVDIKSVSTFRRLFFGFPVPQYVIRPKHPKVCPRCLLEFPYIHKVWEFALVTTCPVHKCLLLDNCPSCGERITWARNKVAVCQCEYDWREYNPPYVDTAELQIAQHIHLLCHLAVNDDNTGPSGSLNTYSPLYRVDLENFVSALVFVASQLMNTDYKKGKRVVDTKGKNFASKSRNAEIHTFLYRALSVFNNWPNNYFDFLEWRRMHMPNRRFRAGLDRDFAEYKSALYYQLASEQLNFMREGFEEYLVTRWAGGYVAHVRRLSPSLRMHSKYVSRKDAREFLRIKVEGIDRLIALGKLKAVISNNGTSRGILIERASLDSVKQELGHSLNLKQVAKMLGVTSQRVYEMIECNLLRPITDEGIDDRSDHKFNSEEVKCLVDSVKDKVVKSRRIAASERVSDRLCKWH